MALGLGWSGAIAFLLLVAPFGQGVGPHPLLTILPPYPGIATTTSTAASSGCGSFIVTKAPAFNKTHGIASMSEWAHSTGCRSALHWDTASVDGSAGLTTKSFTTTTGVHKVVIQWKVVWTANLTVTPSPASTVCCYATTDVYVNSFVYDATTNSYTYYGVYFPVNRTVSGLINFHGSQLVTLYINGSFTAGHTYYIETYVFTSAATFIYHNSGTATAKLNLATGGNMAKLLSITRT